MILSVDTSWPYPSQICHHPVSSRTKWPLWQGWRSYVGSQYEPIPTKANLATVIAGCPIFQQQRPPWQSSTWHHVLGVISQVTGGRLTHWINSIMKGAEFCSYWIRYFLCIQIGLSCTQGF